MYDLRKDQDLYCDIINTMANISYLSQSLITRNITGSVQLDNPIDIRSTNLVLNNNINIIYNHGVPSVQNVDLMVMNQPGRIITLTNNLSLAHDRKCDPDPDSYKRGFALISNHDVYFYIDGYRDITAINEDWNLNLPKNYLDWTEEDQLMFKMAI